MRDPPGSRDVRHRIAHLFPEYGGWSLLRLFGQQRYSPWCSSSLHLHRRRLRPRLRPRRPLRPHLRHRLRLRQCAPCAHMVFTELFEFFVAFFELRRRVLRFIRPCARSSGVTSSLRPAPPRRHRRRPLLPLRLLQQLRAASASSSSPFFCACDRRGGLLCWFLRQRRLGGALSLARPVLATPVRAIVPDAFTGLANPGMCRSMACLRRLRHRLSLRLPRRVAVFVSGVVSVTPPPWRFLVRPRLPVRLLTIGDLDSSPSTTATLRTTSSTTATCSSSASSTSAQRATIRMSFSPVLSSRSIRIAPTLQLRGDVSPSVPTFGFSSSLTVCSAPAVTAGGC